MSTNKLFLVLDEYTTKCCCIKLPTAYVIIHTLNIIFLILVQIAIAFAYFPYMMRPFSYVFFILWIMLSILLIGEVCLNKNYYNGLFKRLQELMCFLYVIGGIFFGIGLFIIFSNKSDPLFDYYIALYYILLGIIVCFELYASYLTYSQYKKCELPDIKKTDAITGLIANNDHY